MQRNTGYFPTESLEPSGNRLFSRSALNEGDLFRGSLIYEETISPNKKYAESEEDAVNYNIEVYQGKDYKILVNAKSNSEFFESLQYELEYGQEITESDIAIEWTTLMGNPKATEQDQLAIAYVSISENGQVFSERKISFGNKAIEIIIDTINKD